MSEPEPTARDRAVVPRYVLALAVAFALTAATSARPRIDLDGPLALGAWAVSLTGSRYGLPPLIALSTLLLVSRPGLGWRDRVREASAVVAALAAVVGGVAYLNEHAIKPAFAVPRPNVIELADGGTLGTTPEGFYELPDKRARSRRLDEVLPEEGLDPRVRAHWVAETGYSFPSGHAFASMGTMAAFLALFMGWCGGWRLRCALLSVPWAAAVCWTRVLLRVHSPADVCAGALEGMAVGFAAAMAARWLARR